LAYYFGCIRMNMIFLIHVLYFRVSMMFLDERDIYHLHTLWCHDISRWTWYLSSTYSRMSLMFLDEHDICHPHIWRVSLMFLDEHGICHHHILGYHWCF
jgi:hypothetical protein